MASSYSRGDATLNQSLNLKSYFSIGGSAYEPFQVRIVNIYDSDPTTGSPTAVASYTPTAVAGQAGWYEIEIPADIISSIGLWYDAWFFTWESGETETNEVQDFYVSRTSELNIINELRILLKDSHPQLDKRRYTSTELEIYLDNALLDINVTPPAFTNYTLDDWEADVPEWKGLILQGGMIFSMISEGIFQIGIEFNYNDNGISLNTNRSSRYQSLAQMMLQNYTKKLEAMKQQFWFQNLHPHAIISAPFGQKIRTYSPRQWRIR